MCSRQRVVSPRGCAAWIYFVGRSARVRLRGNDSGGRILIDSGRSLFLTGCDILLPCSAGRVRKVVLLPRRSLFRQGRMGGHDLPIREEWTRGRYVSTRAGLGCGALVLVVSFVGAGQVMPPGFTSSVASLASAFAGMTVMGRCGVKRSRIAAFGDPNMVA